MIIILLIAAGISLVSWYRGRGFEPLLILLIVVLNAIIGVVKKVSGSPDALKNLSHLMPVLFVTGERWS